MIGIGEIIIVLVLVIIIIVGVKIIRNKPQQHRQTKTYDNSNVDRDEVREVKENSNDYKEGGFGRKFGQAAGKSAGCVVGCFIGFILIIIAIIAMVLLGSL